MNYSKKLENEILELYGELSRDIKSLSRSTRIGSQEIIRNFKKGYTIFNKSGTLSKNSINKAIKSNNVIQLERIAKQLRNVKKSVHSLKQLNEIDFKRRQTLTENLGLSDMTNADYKTLIDLLSKSSQADIVIPSGEVMEAFKHVMKLKKVFPNSFRNKKTVIKAVISELEKENYTISESNLEFLGGLTDGK